MILAVLHAVLLGFPGSPVIPRIPFSCYLALSREREEKKGKMVLLLGT